MKRLNQIEEGLEKMVAKYSKNAEGMEKDKKYLAHTLGVAAANMLYLFSTIELYYIYLIFKNTTLVRFSDDYIINYVGITGIHHYNFNSIEEQFLYSKYLCKNRQNGIDNAYVCGKDESIAKYKGCIKILSERLSSIDFEKVDDKTIKQVESIYKVLTDTLDEFCFKITKFLDNKGKCTGEKYNDIFFRALYKKMLKEKLITGQELQALIDEK